MSNKTELKLTLLDILGRNFQSQGFKWMKSRDGFVKREQINLFVYQLNFLEKSKGYRVEPVVGVRNELIENIFHKTSGFEEKYHKGTISVVESIKDPSTNKKGRYDLYEDRDVDDVVEKLKTLFYEYALAYFDKFSQIENIDQALNDNFDAAKHGFIVGPCSKGLIVAKLVERKNYAELEAFYTERVQDIANGFYLPEFERLKAYLREYKP
ncbi:MAG: hypothetical protein DRR00_27045 [Candidatus Parabeggiatoa sp. nov. 3]|nr:MAG: hypothetical protein DRR00_27045 [Gammaproteobacteria bacterium]RKZ59195.1 MAG: hypothetical protein DRQ99_24095 [Gammaproteobacteria bacterium]